jgi:hypothetical protein
MKKPQLFTMVVLAVLAAVSCGSAPKKNAVPAETPPVAAVPEPVTPGSPEAPSSPPEEFDPNSISQEVFDSTKVEVQQFIGNLNSIITKKNFNAWKATLAPEFFEEISSPAYLQRASESAALKSRNIVLATPNDYFTHVVIPSRANSRVDDIEFVSPSRVKAFTIHPNGQRLRLYDLEHTGNTWLIIN